MMMSCSPTTPARLVTETSQALTREQTREEIEERYARVRETLKKYDIQIEGMVPGVCSISVPNDVDDAQLAILADQLDADVILHEDEEPAQD
jgi:hypothetical protein